MLFKKNDDAEYELMEENNIYSRMRFYNKHDFDRPGVLMRYQLKNMKNYLISCLTGYKNIKAQWIIECLFRMHHNNEIIGRYTYSSQISINNIDAIDDQQMYNQI